MGRVPLLLIMSALFYGYITVGGRELERLGFSLLEIAFYPLATVAAVLIATRPSRLRALFGRQGFSFFLIYGLIGATLQISQYGGIVLGVPVAVVAILLYLQPLWTVLIGRVLLDEPLTVRKALAIGCAVGGSLVLLFPSADSAAYDPAGLALALLGGVALAFWVIWGKRSEKLRQVTAATKVLGYALFTSAVLLVLVPLSQWSFDDPRLASFSTGPLLENPWAVVQVAFLGYLVPSLLFLAVIHRVEAFTAGLILMLEPVSATLLAAWLLSEPVTLNVLAGGALILLANLLVLKDV